MGHPAAIALNRHVASVPRTVLLSLGGSADPTLPSLDMRSLARYDPPVLLLVVLVVVAMVAVATVAVFVCGDVDGCRGRGVVVAAAVAVVVAVAVDAWLLLYCFVDGVVVFGVAVGVFVVAAVIAAAVICCSCFCTELLYTH